jgi:hypothetical protein
VTRQGLGDRARVGARIEKQIDPATAGQTNVEIGRADAETDEPPMSVGERVDRLGDDGGFDAPARKGADIAPVGGDGHLRPDRARRRAFDPGERDESDVDAFPDPREREAQYVGGHGCYHDGIALMLAPAFEGADAAMIEAGDICAILLAAGGSRRFGTDDKLLADVAGEPPGAPRGGAILSR